MNYRLTKYFAVKVALIVFASQMIMCAAWIDVKTALATDVSVILLETPVSLSVEPASANINIGNNQQFIAIAHFADSSTLDVTNDPLTVWNSTDNMIATVNSTGLAHGLIPGFVSIDATYGGETGSGLLTVEAVALVSLTVQPAAATIIVGNNQQFRAIARYADNSEIDVTGDPFTIWESSNIGVATVSGTGLAFGVSVGNNIEIRATYEGQTGIGYLSVQQVLPPGDDDDGGGGGGGGGGIPPGDDDTEPPADDDTEPPGDDDTEPPGDDDTEPPGDDDAEPPGDDDAEPPGDDDAEPPGPPAPGTEVPGPTLPISPVIGIDLDLPPEFQLIPSLIEEMYELGISPIFLPDELGVTRGEAMFFANTNLLLDYFYSDLLTNIYLNFDEAMNIFLRVTLYEEVLLDAGGGNVVKRVAGLPEYFVSIFGRIANAANKFNFGITRFYPDVPPEHPYAYDINVGTMLAIVQGYYEEPNSPFRPNRVISRIEATKVLLGSVDLIDWLYYPEIEAVLGGLSGIERQTTPFNDIKPSRHLMWWYPRYLNLACQIGMYDCTPGTDFRPDDYVTEAEFLSMVRGLYKYLDDTGYYTDMMSDQDKDGLKKYYEMMVYYTNPNLQDTDGEGLIDGDEVDNYFTSPFLEDSDYEGLSDYEEVVTYGTDPLDKDTDDDDFTDFLEVVLGSDPLDPLSFPTDDNANGVDDEWEARYGIAVMDGTQDSDGDGVSDKLEYEYGTNPLLVDTDGDGFTDAEEILLYHTDPNDSNDPGSLENLGVRIINFQEGQLLGDNTPLIKGVAPAGSDVRILLNNDFGHSMVLGTTVTDENSVFIYQVEKPIRDGRYAFVARALEPAKQKITNSMPVHVYIDSSLNVIPPEPKKLADQEISEDVVLKNLRIQIRDNMPILFGTTEFGNRVDASWRSRVFSSALIADAISGEFEIMSPQELELGNHEVYVTATRKKDNAQSDTIKVSFNVAPSLASGATYEAAGERIPLVEILADYWFLMLLLLLMIIILVGGGVYYRFIGRKKNDEEEKKKPVVKK